MDKKKMSYIIYMGFKVKSDSIRMFEISSNRVKSSCYVSIGISPYICTCSNFKLTSKCVHVKYLTEGTNIIIENGLSGFSGDLYDFHKARILDRIFVKYKTSGILSEDFCRCKNALDIVMELVSPTGKLVGLTPGNNTKKIYAELHYAFENGLGLLNQDVRRRDFEEVPEDAVIVPIHSTPRPDSSKFYVSPEVWDQCIYGVMKGKNVLIIGPSGSGKSELVYEVAKAMGYELVAMNMGALSEPRSSLIGNVHFDKDKGTWFAESRFAKALKSGKCCILLDEITRSDREAFNILLPLLDRQGYIAVDEAEEPVIIKRSKDVAFLATANVGMEYTGTSAMDKALKDRFSIIIDMFFPSPELETEILMGRVPGLKKEQAVGLATLAKRQRDIRISTDDFSEYISTRMLLEAADQIAVGVSFLDACKYSIINHFSAEGGVESDRTKIEQIIKKGLTK